MKLTVLGPVICNRLRAAALLAVLSSEPLSSSAVYERMGDATLTRLGLVSYHALRAELVGLAAKGLVERETAPDGSTMWRLAGATGGLDIRAS